MEQPPDFVAQGESSGFVCRKSLYGLKQSPNHNGMHHFGFFFATRWLGLRLASLAESTPSLLKNEFAPESTRQPSLDS